MHKKQRGQYFTPSHIADFMVGLSEAGKNDEVLEPSAGEGVFLESLARAGFKNCTGFEIDGSLANRSPFPVCKESFVSHRFTKQFALVIGNPPYVRWKNLDAPLRAELEKDPLWNRYFNNLADYLNIFLLKSIELLQEGGELIFITPEYWMNNTHSETLRNYMLANGLFECIYHFSETPIFKKVAASTVVFKYRKGKQKRPPQIRLVNYSANRRLSSQNLQALLHDEPSDGKEVIYLAPFEEGKRWLLAPGAVAKELERYVAHCRKAAAANGHRSTVLGDLVDIGNGMVSGLDKAFQLNGTVLNEAEKACLLPVAKAKDLRSFRIHALTPYIFLNDACVVNEAELKSRFPHFHARFEKYREALQKRYSYNRDIKYWDWVFLRNHPLFKKPVNKIFIPSKERISHKSYFRFALAPPGVFPTQDVTGLVPKEKTKESLYYILALLNSRYVFDWMKYKGSVKGRVVEFYEKPLRVLPFRTIDWNNPAEVKLHEAIVRCCSALTAGGGREEELRFLVDQLF